MRSAVFSIAVLAGVGVSPFASFGKRMEIGNEISKKIRVSPFAIAYLSEGLVLLRVPSRLSVDFVTFRACVFHQRSVVPLTPAEMTTETLTNGYRGIHRRVKLVNGRMGLEKL